MMLSLGLGPRAQQTTGFKPSKISGLIADYDLSDINQITFATGSGLGGTISRVKNKVSPGTYDLLSSADQGQGSAHPAYLIGRADHPCASNLDELEASLYTTENLFDVGAGGARTFIHVGHLREDSKFTFWHGGENSSGTSYFNTSGTLRYSDQEGGGDTNITTGINIATGLVITAIVFNSTTDCDFYVGDTSTVTSFDPKDSSLGNRYVAMGRYNGGSGTGKQEMYRTLVYDRALTTEDLDFLLAGLSESLQPSGAVNIIAADGQSNMDGKRSLNFAPTYENEHRMKVWGYNDTLRDYDRTVAIGDKTGNLYSVFDGGSSPAYSMVPAMMDYLARRIQGDIIAVPNARDGIDLTSSGEWGARGTDSFDSSTIFGASNTRIQNCLTATGGTLLFTAFQQGEADANSSVAATQSEYDTALDALISDRRTAFGMPNLPYTIGVISDDCPNPPHTNLSDIQAAQINFSKTAVNIVDTSDSTIYPTFDDIHYNETGLETAGVAHAAAYLNT